MLKEYFKKVRPVMVLSTCVNGIPSSRIVSYAFSNKKNNLIYVVTNPITSKVDEIERNNRVSIVTISGDHGETISSNNAVARISEYTPKEVSHLFKENPFFGPRHRHLEEEIVIEIELFSAVVDVDEEERRHYEF